MKQIKPKKLTMTLTTLNDLPALEEIENECDGNLTPGNFGGLELLKLIT